jgi:hypothetical protein
MLFLGCSLDPGMQSYNAVHGAARETIPAALEIEETFGPQVDHFITHYGIRSARNIWNTEAFFGGRYMLTMQVDVRIDYSRRQVVPTDAPTFFLHEVISVDVLSDGQQHTRFGRSWEIGVDDWQVVYSNGGDFSRIGIVLDDTATPGFSQYVRGLRKDRIPILLQSKQERQ